MYRDLYLSAAQQALKGRLGMKVRMGFNDLPVTLPSVRHYLETISGILEPILWTEAGSLSLTLWFPKCLSHCNLSWLWSSYAVSSSDSLLPPKRGSWPWGHWVPVWKWETLLPWPPFPATADRSGETEWPPPPGSMQEVVQGFLLPNQFWGRWVLASEIEAYFPGKKNDVSIMKLLTCFSNLNLMFLCLLVTETHINSLK